MEYKTARDASETVDVTSNGPAADLDALMDAFMVFLTSMAGGNKEDKPAQSIQREVRRVVEDLLADKPYKPKLLLRLLTIGDVPTG